MRRMFHRADQGQTIVHFRVMNYLRRPDNDSPGC